MNPKCPAVVLAAVLATTVLSARQRPPRLTGAQEPPPPAIGQALTLVEQFHNELRLDLRTQAPAVDEILVAAANDAVPIAEDMLNLRKGLVNANLRNTPEEANALLASYAEDAQKMAEIEATAFAKIYALLKPNQQSRAADAFAIMAGIFLPRPPQAPRAGGSAGGGGR